MRRFIILISCLILGSIFFELNSATYNDYRMGTQENGIYGNTYTPYIPFSSTSSNIKSVEYNTVKPLNADGSVSMDYTTYKGMYKPRRNGWNGGDDEDEWGKPDGPAIGEIEDPVPVGDPDIYVIVLMFLLYLFYHIVKSKKIQNVTKTNANLQNCISFLFVN